MSPWAVEAASLEDGVTLDPHETLPTEAVVVVPAVGELAAVEVLELPPPPHPESGRAMATAAIAGSAHSLRLSVVPRVDIPSECAGRPEYLLNPRPALRSAVMPGEPERPPGQNDGTEEH